MKQVRALFVLLLIESRASATVIENSTRVKLNLPHLTRRCCVHVVLLGPDRLSRLVYCRHASSRGGFWTALSGGSATISLMQWGQNDLQLSERTKCCCDRLKCDYCSLLISGQQHITQKVYHHLSSHRMKKRHKSGP